MKNKYLIMIIISVIGIGIFLSLQNSQFGSSEAPPTQISWRHLLGLNIETGEVSDGLRGILGKKIKMPGFMVPLEDSMEMVGEFLFVPNRQACIHVPPPPPNQMIFVKMSSPIPYDWGPLWLEGILNNSTVESPYGSVFFEVEGLSVKAFE